MTVLDTHWLNLLYLSHKQLKLNWKIIILAAENLICLLSHIIIKMVKLSPNISILHSWLKLGPLSSLRTSYNSEENKKEVRENYGSKVARYRKPLQSRMNQDWCNKKIHCKFLQVKKILILLSSRCNTFHFLINVFEAFVTANESPCDGKLILIRRNQHSL